VWLDQQSLARSAFFVFNTLNAPAPSPESAGLSPCLPRNWIVWYSGTEMRFLIQISLFGEKPVYRKAGGSP
jgi:hypothetical protein